MRGIIEDNRPTLAQYFVEQACPDNKFLEEMNNVIPWWEIESWFKGHLKKERKKTGRPSYPIILMLKKGSKYVDLDVFREYKNRIIAKERARGEHIFAALKRIFKFTRLRYRGLERVTMEFS